MSRFEKLSYVIWHCQYHIVWVPKYRYRILRGKVGFEVSKSIRVHSERKDSDPGVSAVLLFEREALLGAIISGQKGIA